MKLGSSHQRERQRRRQRALLGLFKWIFLAALLAAAAGYAWVTASRVAGQEAATLKIENTQLGAKVGELEAALRESQAQTAVLQERLPSEEESALLEVARRKAGEGVALPRQAEIIAAASRERRCDGAPTVKRFRVRTPITGDEGTAASFANNVITVRAEGRSAKNADGAPEAWFDPAQPIALNFLHINGAAARTEGVLPLHYALAVGKDEYRFQIDQGPVGLIVVAMDRCDYP